MRLVKLTSSIADFKDIPFNRNGISIILGVDKNASDSNDKTFNGIGKSFVIELLHFCLGATPKGNWCEKIGNEYFYLDFEEKGVEYRVSRSTNKPNEIHLNDEVFNKKSFNKKMGEMILKLPISPIRNIFNGYFLRRTKSSYNSFYPLNKWRNLDVSDLKDIFFLLGLDASLIEKNLI